ncbi:MAG: hypothetical protein K9J06_08115 [Flavobacteriales bacterium]|nr:hypothetical protein [Flavobacteriales bacterium]
MRLIPILLSIFVLFGCKNSGSQTATAEKEPAAKKPVMREIITDSSVRISEKDIDFTVTRWDVTGDTLTVGVQHGGGCREHDWQMYFNGAVLKSLPPQAVLQLQHKVKDGPDPCRSIVRETLKFNLSSLRPMTSGKLTVKWAGDAERSATYAF